MAVTKFEVGMTCEECSKACTEILKAIDGVKTVECFLNEKKIIVNGEANSALMLEKLREWSEKNGKGVVNEISA